MSEAFHFENNLIRVAGTKGHIPGPDPNGSSYFSFASFRDPDGNTWLLQEVNTRLPGRGLSLDVASLTELLRETETHHGEYETDRPEAPLVGRGPAADIVARERGRTPEDAAKDAGLHMAGARQ